MVRKIKPQRVPLTFAQVQNLENQQVLPFVPARAEHASENLNTKGRVTGAILLPVCVLCSTRALGPRWYIGSLKAGAHEVCYMEAYQSWRFCPQGCTRPAPAQVLGFDPEDLAFLICRECGARVARVPWMLTFVTARKV